MERFLAFTAKATSRIHRVTKKNSILLTVTQAFRSMTQQLAALVLACVGISGFQRLLEPWFCKGLKS